MVSYPSLTKISSKLEHGRFITGEVRRRRTTSSSTSIFTWCIHINTCKNTIKTKKPLEVGRTCILHLTIPGCDEPVEVQGAVVWSSKDAEDVDAQEQGMGIKYSSEEGKGLSLLKEVLARLEEEAAAS